MLARSVRGVELTACGHALLPRAEQLLGDIRRTVEAVEQVKGEMSGRVAVGTMPSIALTALPHAVTAFRQSMPNVSLHLEEVTVPDALAQLRNGTLDIAAMHHVPALDRDFTQSPLLSTEFTVVMREGHPLARARRLEALLDAEWIVTVGAEQFPHSVMVGMFEAHGLPLPKRLLRSPMSFAVTLARRALGRDRLLHAPARRDGRAAGHPHGRTRRNHAALRPVDHRAARPAAHAGRHAIRHVPAARGQRNARLNRSCV